MNTTAELNDENLERTLAGASGPMVEDYYAPWVGGVPMPDFFGTGEARDLLGGLPSPAMCAEKLHAWIEKKPAEARL